MLYRMDLGHWLAVKIYTVFPFTGGFINDNTGERRFIFETQEGRFNFIKRLNELGGVEYHLYESQEGWNVDVSSLNEIKHESRICK